MPDSVTRNVVLTQQQFDIIRGIQSRRQCNFSEALRRVLDNWIDLLEEGKAKA